MFASSSSSLPGDRPGPGRHCLAVAVTLVARQPALGFEPRDGLRANIASVLLWVERGTRRIMFLAAIMLAAAMTSLVTHAQQPPYGVQYFYAQPHYNNFAHARDIGTLSPARDGLRTLHLPAPPLDDEDVRAARLAHLAAHESAQAHRARRDTFVAVRPVLETGAQYELPSIEGRFAFDLRMPSVSQQAFARGALPVAAVHDQQVSPLQVAGNEAVLPVHVHRSAVPPSFYEDDSLRSGIGHEEAQQQSLSARAALFGAVPVAAVHDQQTAPHQWRGNHQTRPLYVERFE